MGILPPLCDLSRPAELSAPRAPWRVGGWVVIDWRQGDKRTYHAPCSASAAQVLGQMVVEVMVVRGGVSCRTGRLAMLRPATGGCQTGAARGHAVSSSQVELPRDPEAILDPAELRAEPVVCQRHQHRPALREPGE